MIQDYRYGEYDFSTYADLQPCMQALPILNTQARRGGRVITEKFGTYGKQELKEMS